MNELEETFSTLDLSLPSELHQNDLLLEDVQEMAAAIKDQLKSTKSTLDNLVSRHIPAFMKKYTSSERLEKATSDLNNNIEQAVKFLRSINSPRGCEISFTEEKNVLKKELVNYQGLVDRIKKYQIVYSNNNQVRRLVTCANIDEASTIMLAVEKDLELINEELGQQKENQSENNMLINDQNISFFEAFNALVIETAKTHAVLILLLERLWDETVNFELNSDYVKCTIKKFIRKSKEEVDKSESHQIDSGDDFRCTDVVQLYDVICSSIRLNRNCKFVTDDLAKKFFDNVFLPILGSQESVVEVKDTEESFELIVKLGSKPITVVQSVLETWKTCDNLQKRFEARLQCIHEVLQWFAKCFTEKEYDTRLFDFDLLGKYFWGNSTTIVGNKVQSSNKNCLSYVLSQIIYLNIDVEVLSKPLDSSALLITISDFEQYIEHIGIVQEHKSAKILSALLRSIIKTTVEKQRNRVLLQAKNIICGDYYKTVSLSEAMCRSSHANIRNFKALMESTKAQSLSELLQIKSTGSLSAGLLNNVKHHVNSKLRHSQTNLPKNTTERPYFEFLNTDFYLSEMVVSENTAAIVDMCYNLLDAVVIQEKIQSQESSYLLTTIELCRDIFFLASTLTETIHDSMIKGNKKYAAIFYNDCQFLVHTFGTFTYTYHRFLPSEIASNFLLMDLIPKLRERGKAVLDDIMLEEKSAVFNSIQTSEIENPFVFSKAAERLARVKLLVQKSTQSLIAICKLWKNVLSDKTFLVYVGSLVEYCLNQVGKLMLTKSTERSLESFNVLELVDLKSTIEKFLAYVINDLLSMKSITISKQPELDNHTSIGKFIPSYLKYEQLNNVLNETLSKSILQDIICQGKLYLLTSEETKIFSDFLFLN